MGNMPRRPREDGGLADSLTHNGTIRWTCAHAARTDNQRIEWLSAAKCVGRQILNQLP
jgi:hypothetical protein